MQPSGRRTCLEKVLLLTLALCLVSIIVLAALFAQSASSEQNEICLTKECAQIAARVTTSIDYRVNPCDNFYDYACGMWMKKHVVPEDTPNLFTHSLVREDVMITIKYLLEESREKEIEAVGKARDYYSSCMNTSQIEHLNVSSMIDLLSELGGMPVLGNNPGGQWNESRFDLMDVLVKTQRVMSPPLVHVYIGLDDKQSDTRIIHIAESSKSTRQNTDVADVLRDSFLYFGLNMLTLLGADPLVAKQDMLDMFNLDIAIANISVTKIEKRNRDMRYNKMSIADLETNFSSSNTNPNTTDDFQFEWLQFIQRTLNIAGGNVTLDTSENVIVTSPNYLRNIFDVLHQHSTRTIKNYLVWMTITDLFTKLPHRFMEKVVDYKNFLTGTSKNLPRWKKCCMETMGYFGMAVGRMFVQERFDEEAKHKALEMIHDIREAFYQRLPELDWMDPVTSGLAKEKAHQIIEMIGYPEYILDDSELNAIYDKIEPSQGEYFMNYLNLVSYWRNSSLEKLRERFQKSANRLDVPPAQVNAFYLPNLNVISFPAGILQPPYYSKHQPVSMNYGSIGWLIGHEMIHGFDDIGRRYDKDGNLRQWWSNEAISKFTNKTQCIIEQYSRYKIQPVGLNIDGVLTQGENIADNGGLVLSYKAYQNWLKRNKHVKEPRLPGVNLSHEELFFVNFAQGWCGVATDEYKVQKIFSDSHSPVRYRIIGPLQNSREFSRVFNCREGSYMNPINKCNVW